MNDEKPIQATSEFLVPVKLINPDICMACPDIDIENEQMQISNFSSVTYVNRLVCRHYERCSALVKGVKDGLA